jgi:hypothetical protein
MITQRLEHDLIDRLADRGIEPAEIRHAIALIRSGRAELIQAVLDGDLELHRALQVARARVDTMSARVGARRHAARSHQIDRR